MHLDAAAVAHLVSLTTAAVERRTSPIAGKKKTISPPPARSAATRRIGARRVAAAEQSANEDAVQPTISVVDWSAKQLAEDEKAFRTVQTGLGECDEPFRLPLRESPNASGCIHCPTSRCVCVMFARLLQESLAECDLKRRTEVAGARWLCAKSIMPCFVHRMIHIQRIRSDDTFYDLGSGNGSVLFQVAFQTGARCVGVELSPHNAAMSRALWEVLRPKLEAAAGRPMPVVQIIEGDLTEFISDPAFGATPKTAIWTANLLLPRAVTHFMSERFRTVAAGCRWMAFDDLYPHGRSVMRRRDPEAFELFAMENYVWPSDSVEWCHMEGPFYFNRKLK